MRYLDIYISICASVFFIYHIFGGQLGLWADYKYIIRLNEAKTKLESLKYENKKLLYYNKAFGSIIHPDYLETLVLKHLYKMPKNSKLMKL